MSGECERCGDHCLDCFCKTEEAYDKARAALNEAVNQFNALGYHLKRSITFEKEYEECLPRGLEDKWTEKK